MQLIPTNHTVQDGEQNHMSRHAWRKWKLIVPAQQGALPYWTDCQSDATQTFLCVCIKTWTSLWKKILPGSFSVNTLLVSFIVNSEQHPASGIVSTPLPGNNRSGLSGQTLSICLLLCYLIFFTFSAFCIIYLHICLLFFFFTVTWDEKTHSGISPHIIMQYVHFLLPVSIWY